MRAPARADAPVRDWTGPAGRLVDPATTGTWTVTGPAGSGVSELLLDAVATRIAGPDGLAGRTMVIATGKEQAFALAGRLRQKLGGDFTGGDAVVRSVHSLAFAVVRAHAARHNQPEPRLITGAEQDNAFRELLAGQAADQTGTWPEDLRPALALPGFARGLKDLILRAAERGLDPAQLAELGATHDRAVWVAAADFWRDYRRTMALSGTRTLSAAELVHTAVCLLEEDTGLAATVRAKADILAVDDAQNFDPASCRLIGMLADHARLAVIAGDTAQSVFHFRGATGQLLGGYPTGHTITLPGSFRHPVTSTVICPDTTTQADLIADTLRRRHAADGIAWRDMAVIVRSTGDTGPLTRRLAAADIPVASQQSDTVLTRQPLVKALLTALDTVTGHADAEKITELALGPIGGADPVLWRSLLRGLAGPARRAGTDAATFAARLVTGQTSLPGWDGAATATADDAPTATAGPADGTGRDDTAGEKKPSADPVLSPREDTVLRRVAGVLGAGRAAHARGESVEMLLWSLWSAAGLADKLAYAALGGGSAGARADADLDCVMALFDVAGDFTEHRPGSGAASFVRWMAAQDLPIVGRLRRDGGADAVTVVTAHGAAGGQWNTVIVAGVQEGSWPTTSVTGSLFDQEELVGLIDRDIDPSVHVNHLGERIREEQRLLDLACSRATDRLVVTAVDAPDSDEALEVSRFIDRDAATCYRPPADGGFPVISVPAVVGQLRRIVCDRQAGENDTAQAGRQLARLAAAGVPGADPAQWWGVHGPSTDTPPAGRDAPVRLSPSMIDTAVSCPLRAVLGRWGNEDADTTNLVLGTIIHAFAQGLADGIDPEAAADAAARTWLEYLCPPPWRKQAAEEEFRAALNRTATHVAATAARCDPVGAEIPVRVPVAATADGRPIIINGRLDRLDLTGTDKAAIITDFKTGTTIPTRRAANDNLQLYAYQLALSKGQITTGPDGPEITAADSPDNTIAIDHAELVYVRAPNKTSGIAVLAQARKDAVQLAGLEKVLVELAAATHGPQLAAYVTDACRRTDFAAVCRFVAEGRTTTNDRP